MSFDSVGSTGGGVAFLWAGVMAAVGGFLPASGVTVSGSGWMRWSYPSSGRHWCRFRSASARILQRQALRRSDEGWPGDHPLGNPPKLNIDFRHTTRFETRLIPACLLEVRA